MGGENMGKEPQRIRCFPCGKEMYLSNLPRHMMEIHGITITRDQIYEFDYVLRRFNQLKEEIFGVDYITDLMDSESECSTDDINELTVTTSAMYCIKSISHHLKTPVSTDKIPEIVVSQPLSNRSVLSTHSVKSVKSELPSAESVNLLKSEPPSVQEILKTEPSPVVVEEPIPFLRSRMHDPLMFDFITEDFAEEVLAENVQDELYDILDEMIEGEIVAREMEAYISQNLEAKSKAKKGKSQLSVDGKSLNEKTSSKSIKSKESKNSIKLEKKKKKKKHKGRNPSKTPSKTSTKTEKSTRSGRSEKSEKSVASEGKKDRKKSKEKS